MACQKNDVQCEKLAEKLREIDASLEEEFRKALEGNQEAASMEMEAAFISGFRLGARMTLEVFQEE